QVRESVGRSAQREEVTDGLDAHLSRKLIALWPDAATRARAVAALKQYGIEPHQREAARVRLAILKLSDGDEPRLADLVSHAKGDYRDVLLWAEYPAEANETWSLRPNLTAEERARLDNIRRADRQQYLAWLNR